MKKIITSIVVLNAIFSCNQNEKNADISKNEEIEMIEDNESKHDLQINGNKSSKNDTTLITCQCPEPYLDASIQLRINYSSEYVKLCTWFYNHSTKNVNEFQIFDHNDNLIFEGFPPSEYKVMRIEQPLTIRKMTTLPDKKGQWSLTPIYDIQIDNKESQFTTNTHFIFQPPILDKTYQDSIYQVFNNQPQHKGNYNKNNPPFANENYIVKLFLCALNDNRKCINAFENLNTRFVTDGAIGQLYSELLSILKIYQRKKV